MNRHLTPYLLIFLVAATFEASADHLTVTGPARVIDGDTLEIGYHKIRIEGIDAPETRQTCGSSDNTWPCGNAATNLMRSLSSNQTVLCKGHEIDRYQRLIACCFVDDLDLGETLVRNGLALAYRQFSDRYIDAENNARSEGIGMWSGPFIAPWDWRRQ